MEEKEEYREVMCGDVVISYTLRRKKVKNLNLRIGPDGKVTVSSPFRVPLSVIEGFILQKAGFIQKALQRAESSPVEKKRTCETGESFRFFGKTLRIQIEKGKKAGAALVGDVLLLTVTENTNREKLFDGFCREKSREIFRQMTMDLCPLLSEYAVPMPEITVRRMKSRWGSCAVGKGRITLNLCLMEAPSECIQYVIFHELCHFVHPNHSKSFHQLVSSRMPDWKERKQKLREANIL